MVTNIDSGRADGIGVDSSRTIGEKAQAKELVVVEWQDIISDNGWVVEEDCELPTFYTVGWLEYQDQAVIKICTTLDFDDALEEHKKKEKPIGYAVTCFPTGCVTSLSFLTPHIHRELDPRSEKTPQPMFGQTEPTDIAASSSA
tara:strand:- start:806 stop:1237 length:432 start_codon:yes stop_codon:yes gene_type:complete